MKAIAPPLLQPGDRVAVVSPAKNADRARLEAGIAVLDSWGLQVEIGTHAFARDGRFAGTDQQRAADLQKMVDSVEIKAIFCSRGGYGTTRILDRINISKLANHPKWIVGFSDITGLLIHLAGHKIQSLHAVVPIQMGETKYAESTIKLRDFLFTGTMSLIAGGDQIQEGTTTAPVMGGNLSLLTHIIGSSSDYDPDGTILFLEEVDEPAYRVDRMMVQLARSGKLGGIQGAVLGHFSNIRETESMGKSAPGIVLEHLAGLDIPIGVGFPIGHEAPNFPVALGREATLRVEPHRASLSFT